MLTACVLLALGALLLEPLLTYFRSRARRESRRRRTNGHGDAPKIARNPRKPDWVRKEVLRLRALSNAGARTVAATFNLLHAKRGESVGKTFVANLVRDNGEAILRLRRELKHRKPRRVPRNLLWALDLTFLPGNDQPRPVFGLIDHGSRACLALKHLRDRSTVGVLRLLLDAIERRGKPLALRTDNEPILTSRLFRMALWILRIRHQRTLPHCPWQNGRIERLFLTLKEKLLGRFDEVGAPDDLTADLDTVRAWYNHLRPHQHLDGRPPAMAWKGIDKPRGKARLYSLWNGRLTGVLFPT